MSEVDDPAARVEEEPGSRRRGRNRGLDAAVAAVALVAVGVGAVLRLWFLFHEPISSDDAVVGLMVRQILHGHGSAFYWGQAYGGAEPYLAAPLVALLGPGVWVLRLTPILLAALAAVLTWRIARRLVDDRRVAVLAGVLVWVGPEAALWNSTHELGFRGVTMVCGLGVVLGALRLLQGRRTLLDAAMVGFVAGIGWWSSPEIAYFLVVAGILVVVAARRTWREDTGPSWLRLGVVAAVGAVAGGLPWLWANAQTRLASIRPGSFQVPAGTSFGGNLTSFFTHALPLELGLQRKDTGAWLFGNGRDHPVETVLVALLVVLVLAAVVGSLVACLRRDATSRALAAGILAFPLLFAASPATWHWQDGRYAVYLGPLLVLSLAVGAEELGRLLGAAPGHGRADGVRRAAPWAPTAVLLVALVTATGMCFIGFHESTTRWPVTFVAGWGDPDAPAGQSAKVLAARGVDTGYADYWVAYKLDLLGHGSLRLTTAGNDADRSKAIAAAVARSPRAAWLFVPADQLPTAVVEFGYTPMLVGPDGMTQQRFEQVLGALHVGFRVVDAGLVVAVVPDRSVSPAEAGLPPA